MRPILALLLTAALASAQESPGLPWLASADSILEYIRDAPVQRIEEIPIGVTKPRRALLPPDGPVGSLVIKDLKPGRRGGYWESYRSEIAAYELDRMLDLNMVPPTVEKRVNGVLMSAQMFVEGTVWLKELQGQQPPNVESWNRQVNRQKAFDNLIANIDRNAGNLLVYRSPEWHLVLIDHSRCFVTSRRLQFTMTKIDRPFFERLRALDKGALEARIGKLLADGVNPVLARRDAIVKHFEGLAAANGDDQVFTP